MTAASRLTRLPAGGRTAGVLATPASLVAVVALLLLVLTTACEPNRFCLDCATDAGSDGSTLSRYDGSVPSDGAIDVIAFDACVLVGPESCNGLDDDCDGLVDEGVPEAGDPCNEDLPLPCTAGGFECIAGALVCGDGAVLPMAESCNVIDDDCDGVIDDGDPGGGGFCGTDTGECLRGLDTCVDGVVLCIGAIDATAELCDGRDNNCDAVIDDNDPEGGSACGESIGECVAGVVRCVGGVIQCQGSLPATIERCDTLDNDCDGVIDEDFDFTADPANCGGCGLPCAAPNALGACAGGLCGIAFCHSGFWDLDGDMLNGCEYACDLRGAEICNGGDDNCDGSVDEALVEPSICIPFGECADAIATCGGVAGWSCAYPPTVSLDAAGDIIPETACDTLDNDCDGMTDEAYPTIGQSCSQGTGACRTTGFYVCTPAGDAVVCTAPPPPPPPPPGEFCNGIDDDCDGSVDEGASTNWVAVSGGAIVGTKYIFRYEASRPDASAIAGGTTTARACSNANVLPWTNVTHPQAEAACAAAGGRLCSETEWSRACTTAASPACQWSYDSACTSYVASKCNGNDYDSNPAAPGNQDALLATAALTQCYAGWGGATNRIHDLSGNVKEWTLERSAAVNPMRGGSYNNTANGIACGFNFVVADDAFQFANVGFRCCRDTAP